MGIGGVGMTSTAPTCGREGGRKVAGDALCGGSSIRCDGVSLINNRNSSTEFTH